MNVAFWREKLALAIGSVVALAAFVALVRGEPLPAGAAEPSPEPSPTATPTPAFRPLLPPNVTRVPTATPDPAVTPTPRAALPAPGRAHSRTRTS
jgi:hypothetical protein